MVTANASDVKHKLYMRMVMRMTEKFGGDQRSLRVIKECLDLKLNNRQKIDAGVSAFDIVYPSFLFLFIAN